MLQVESGPELDTDRMHPWIGCELLNSVSESVEKLRRRNHVSTGLVICAMRLQHQGPDFQKILGQT